jgi:dolichol-phosphate mannosyltransferase
MSTLRYDPAHRPGPARTGRPRRRTAGNGPSPGEGDAGKAWGMGCEPRSLLSVVVPAKNEAAGLPQLVDEVARALRPLRDGDPRRLAGFEIIIVDDGSTDRTPEVLRGLAADYPELKGMMLRPGVGQSSATVAGIRAARGDWIATLDADLQNDPADLVRLWEALPGHDVALGWRVERRDAWSRRIISRWANRVRNGVLGQSIRDTGCSVRIFPRAAALRLPMFRGVHRFFGPLLVREGCRLVQVPVGHRPRPHGRSHYNLWNRSIQVVVDLLGVAWLLRRPLAYRVVQAWDASEAAGGAYAQQPWRRGAEG